MSLYILIPLFSCIASAVMATLVYLRNPGESANKNAALLLASGALWAACEVVYSTRTDAESALLFVKLSALGWAWSGPLSVRLLLDITANNAFATALYQRKGFVPTDVTAAMPPPREHICENQMVLTF